MLQRTEYEVDPQTEPCADVLVVRPAGEPHALVYIPPIKGSVPTVEVYAEAAEAESRAARLCETEGLLTYRVSDDHSGDWMRGLVARSAAPAA
ncbi:hypothetical protein [Aureimonas sp. AU4]|uniref:hypothetical protein n=1 Tax=Aureimonas sp. AU4 TaxID=1638163 RepID=UPI000783911F|nr:hypothetical protein [Aureimonas sp. AU4]